MKNLAFYYLGGIFQDFYILHHQNFIFESRFKRIKRIVFHSQVSIKELYNLFFTQGSKAEVVQKK